MELPWAASVILTVKRAGPTATTVTVPYSTVEPGKERLAMVAR